MADTDANETEASSTARIAFDHVRLCESRAHGTPCETCDASVRALPGGKDGFLWRAAVARKGQPVQRLKIRPTFLPFHSVRPIQPGEKVAVVSHPQMPFKGKRLYIPKDCGAFDLLDVKVGSNSQNVAPGAAPAEAGDAAKPMAMDRFPPTQRPTWRSSVSPAAWTRRISRCASRSSCATPAPRR